MEKIGGIYMLKVKEKAPEFSLENQDGKKVKLLDFLGKKVVIFFYPKDHTPGCTTQVCGFRDIYNVYLEKDIIVLGISKDSVTSHQSFIEKFQLPFILLSDPNLEAIQAYGVWVEKNMYGNKSFGVQRSTFIVDEFGMIEKIFPKANPDTNAQEIIDYLA